MQLSRVKMTKKYKFEDENDKNVISMVKRTKKIQLQERK